VHEGGFSAKGKAPDELVFSNQGGLPLVERWEPPELPADPLAQLKTRHADSGLEIDSETGRIEWWGEPMDLEMAIDGLPGPKPSPDPQDWSTL
jgi:hypothetical protein